MTKGIVMGTEGNFAKVSQEGALSVQLAGSVIKQTQVGGDKEFVFANEALADNQQTATITAPANPGKKHEIIVNNPSTVTDLTVKLFNIEADLVGDTDKDAYITSFVVPKSGSVTGTLIDTHAAFIEGLFNGGDLKLVVSNNTVLGETDGFTATVRIREVG